MRKPNKRTEYTCSCGKSFTLKKKVSHIPVCPQCSRTKLNEKHRKAKWHLKPKYRELAKNWRLKNVWGMDRRTYDKMVEEQGGVCAICKCPDPRNQLCIDHNHRTGDIRGLLCHRCNRGLGIIRDDVNVLYDFIKYLNKYDIQHQPL